MLISPPLSRLVAFVVTAFAIGGVAAQQDIVPLNPPQPVENDGKIEVLEFFSYACPHCANADGPITTWTGKQAADVKFRRVPVDGINGYVGGVSLFYTLEAMGELDRLHAKIFNAFHVEHVILANPATLNKWLEKNGVDPKKFEEVKSSFSVMTKTQRALKMNADYQVSYVPTMVVNGRFQVLQNQGPAKLLEQTDKLIQQVRAAAPAKAAAAKK